MILLFDFDGTLHRTDAIYGYAVRKVLRELSFPVPAQKLEVTDRELSHYLGVHAEAMWEAFLPQLPVESRKDVIRKVGDYMNEGILAGKTALYDGVPEVLDELKRQGHTLLILSNCTIKYMEAQKKAHQLDRWFSGYYCSEAYYNIPKEMIFEEIRKEYQGEFIMIGDRRSDIQVALTHHLKSVGCRYGYGTSEELADADMVINNIYELDVDKCQYK